MSCQITTLVVAPTAGFTAAATLWRETTAVASILVMAATAIGTGLSIYNFDVAWWGLRLLLPTTNFRN